MAKSVMKHEFSRVPQANIQRSTFNRSHGHKTTFDAGYLIPYLVDEVLPGDTFTVNSTLFARLATPIKPVMDNMFLDTHFFFVPNRLVWDNWVKFCGEQTNPGDSIDYTVPVITDGTGFSEGDIFDYMGLPPAINFDNVSGGGISALPLRCYNLIWNEWFRDQNLQNSVTNNTGDGPDAKSDYALLRRGKRHDYFSSSLPWPQKGDSVSIPLGSSAPITGFGFNPGAWTSGSLSIRETDGTGTVTYTSYNQNDQWMEEDPNNAGYPNIRADLTNATAATINSLRQAFQVQKLLERDARGGTRYQELVKSHFGVTGLDSRFQRPEYLGGGSTPIIVSQVQQQSSTDATTPQGNLAAYGTAFATNHGFTRSFTEHGWIIGLVSVRADLTYQQGVERQWSRQTRYDFYWPALAHIGEQAVLQREIYAQGTAQDNNVWGYQERFAEYRYKPSRVSAQMRSSHSTSLDIWHLSQELSTPVLDDTFIQENPPVDRVISVPAEPHFIMDSYTQMRCARPMPVYGVPGLIDHF